MTRPIVWLAMATGVAIVVALLWLVVDGQPLSDGAVFAYVGQGLLEGDQPWVDRWDHKGPSIYLANAAGLWLTPGSWLGLHVLELTTLVAAGILAVAALKPAFGSVPAILAIIAVGLTLSSVAAPGNFTEQWALLPQCAALYLFARLALSDARREAALLVGIGALGALAFLFRPNLIGIWAAMGIYLFVLGSRRVRRVILIVLGGGATLLVVAAAMVASGAWGAFVEAAISYNVAYSQNFEPAGVLESALRWLDQSAQSSTGWLIVSLTVLGWLAVIPFNFQGRRGGPGEVALARLAFIAVPVEIALLSIAGRTYEHYLIAILPALAVLTAFVTSRIVGYFDGRRTGQSVQPAALVATAVGSAWLTLVLVTPLLPAIAAARPTNAHLLHEAAASRIKEEVSSEETVLVWGHDTLVHLLSDRRSPSRFFYQFPLVTVGYTSEQLIAEFVTELEQNPPAMILDTRSVVMPPIDAEVRAGFKPELAQYEVDAALLDPFYDFVAGEYKRSEDIGHWAVYTHS